MKRLALTSILALGLAFSLTACGGDSGGGSSGASGPVGTWTLDIPAFREAMEAGMQKEMEGKSEAEIAMMKGFIEPMLKAFETATMEVTVKDDGTWIGESNFPDGPKGELKAETSRGSWTLDGRAIWFYESLGGVRTKLENKDIFGHIVPNLKIEWQDVSTIGSKAIL